MALFILFLLPFLLPSEANRPSNSQMASCMPKPPDIMVPAFPYDMEQLRFALNLEHIEADFFLFGALGRGLDAIAPELANGGPPPIGATKAKLDKETRDIIEEFGYQEVGHLRAIKSMVGPFPRPQIDLSVHNFAKIMDDAFGINLVPPFDPYSDTVHYLLASYVIPYMGLVAYVGSNPNTDGYAAKRLVAGLLGVEAGQDAVIRTLLYKKANKTVAPYNQTVAEFTNQISKLRNQLAMCGIKDKGLIVPEELGAEHRTTTNVLSANEDSLSYRRTPAEVLRVLYGTGDEHKPGGFLPLGANGAIAREFL